jgi:7-carboxy-7-deazaguanine synthase
MSKLHYVEKFFSIQAEGRYVGVPSVFLRMFGCNFKCRNFSRYGEHILGDSITHNPEVVKVIENMDSYKTFDDLPLVETGCDSYAAVYPEFKRFAIKETHEELAPGIVNLLPFNEWRDEHLVITGGEPLLGWQRAYPDLLDHHSMRALKELTFETNGTQMLTKEFRQYLMNWTLNDQLTVNKRARGYQALTFSVSVKLSCSGEKREDAVKPEVLLDYQSVGHTYLKLVVANHADVSEALEVVDIFRKAGFTGHVYLMPAGGTTKHYNNLSTTEVANLALKYGMRYSPRLQIDLFGNSWGT